MDGLFLDIDWILKNFIYSIVKISILIGPVFSPSSISLLIHIDFEELGKTYL